MEESKQNDPQIIVAGEASESDDEDFQESQDVQEGDGGDDKEPAVSQQTEHSDVIVSGEASESDEEYEIIRNEDIPKGLPPLNVQHTEKGDDNSPASPLSPELQLEKSRYNSLLCRKLRERNIALRRHIVDSVHQSYTIAGKDLHNLAIQLQKSHIAIQDVTYLMRDTTNSLFKLEDKVNIVASCSILPDIHIPEPSNQAAQQS